MDDGTCALGVSESVPRFKCQNWDPEFMNSGTSKGITVGL